MNLPWVKKLSLLQGILLSLLASFPVAAQIKPDATLPHNSLVTPKLGNVLQIDGGTRAGNNLFHSFSQFNVPTGGTAFFNNALDVSNIFSRVTGGSASSIDGILKANGTANLFLLNPNGIIFGAGAQLNIGGSFLGTTASTVKFADSTLFSTTDNQNPTLLTVSVPIGLQLVSNPGAIRVMGTGHSLTLANTVSSPIIGAGSLTGLRVLPQKTFALIGGNISLEGGTVSAPGGLIELGALQQGEVSLNSTNSGWNFGYEGASGFKDIQLVAKAAIDATGNGGSIDLRGRNINILDASVIVIHNQGVQPSGNINLNASDTLEISGTSLDGNITTRVVTTALGEGKGGDITVFAPQLVMSDGGVILASSYTAARVGSITVNAPNSIQLLGPSHINPFFETAIANGTFSAGNAGDVTIYTGNLTLKDSSFIATSTFGTGSGGLLNVRATQSVELVGVNPVSLSPSMLGVSTFGVGNAGNLEVNTSKLVVRNGAKITASTLATGNAGAVTINASESVEISGTSPGNLQPSLVNSSASIVNEIFQELLKLPPVPSGASGNVIINTPRLSVTDNGLVSANNDGSKSGGSIKVNANSIILNNHGSITAATQSGTGGDIILQTNSLQAFKGSSITATAGGSGNGGNQTINADTLVALQNSSITANAFQGRGGNILINAQGLFLSPDAAIRASSQFGSNGVVQVNTLGFDVKNALIPTTGKLVSTEQAIAGSCLARSNKQQGRFIVTGTGGLATTPYDFFHSRYRVIELQPLSAGQSVLPNQSTHESTHWKIGDPIVEATGIVRTPDGKVLLSSTPQNTPESASELVCYSNEDKPKS